MLNEHYLKSIVRKQKEGKPVGVYSVCSTNEYVIKATLKKGLLDNSHVLIESTCNQVNQYGGYTGRNPEEFREFVFSLAREMNFPITKIILGGDHLGPNPWQEEKNESAMCKAKELVSQYIMAGYSKIHLDASMCLADDHNIRKPEVIAARTAELCKAAEKAHKEIKESNDDIIRPVYVIGTEVPKPGGIQIENDELELTRSTDFHRTVELTRKAFLDSNLNEAWENVIAVVVQPGVEFGNSEIIEYRPEKANQLVSALHEYPNLLFEGHSTDYQTPATLKKLVEDGIAILKVGPALTFAVREALFSLNIIEEELLAFDYRKNLSRFRKILNKIMIEKPADWQRHYHGSEKDVHLMRKYSFSDRWRYYYEDPRLKGSLEVLLTNLQTTEIPLSLISQYLPGQYIKIRKGRLSNSPEDLIIDKVIEVLDGYSNAVGNTTS